MHELFVAFLENPTLEAFQAVRAIVVGHPKYDGYAHDLNDMDDAYQQKRYADVKGAFQEAMPNLLLSPGAHMLLCLTLRAEGHEQHADMERFICFRCLDGIKLTGDGTREQPYLVLRTSDEYDLLGAMGKERTTQHLLHEGGRNLDRIECIDGSELWFDVTDMMAALARQLGDPGRPAT